MHRLRADKQLFRFFFGDLAGALSFLLGHFGKVLHGDLIIHQHFHLTGTLQFRDRLVGFYNGQRCV